MSDLAVFHRVDDVAALTISRFLMLVVRLSAYSGALRARFTQEPSTGRASPADAVPATAGVPSAGGGGDTPIGVLRAMKAQQFAARLEKQHKPGSAPVDPNGIRWDNDEIFRELVK